MLYFGFQTPVFRIPQVKFPDSLTLGTPFLCSLRSRRLEVVGSKNGPAGETRVSPSRALSFLRALVQAPASQATSFAC